MNSYFKNQILTVVVMVSGFPFPMDEMMTSQSPNDSTSIADNADADDATIKNGANVSDDPTLTTENETETDETETSETNLLSQFNLISPPPAVDCVSNSTDTAS